MTERLCSAKAAGFAGFGVAAFMYSLVHAGLFPAETVDSGIAAAAAIFAGLTLLIAGILEYLRGSHWHAAFFLLFGVFWWAVHSAEGGAASPAFVGLWYLVWTVFSLSFWYASLKADVPGTVKLLALGTALTLLCFAVNFFGLSGFRMIAGYVGLVTALLALYATAGEIINTSHGKTVLPGS